MLSGDFLELAVFDGELRAPWPAGDGAAPPVWGRGGLACWGFEGILCRRRPERSLESVGLLTGRVGPISVRGCMLLRTTL
jgi:hypothetical protein